MKKFFSSLREHVTNVINFENKRILSLTKKELKLRICYIYRKKLMQKFAKDKNYHKVRGCCYFTGK